MLFSMAIVRRPCVLHANASALSASEYVTPPWHTPKPFTISGRTTMRHVDRRGATSTTVIPSHRENSSRAIIRVTIVFASFSSSIAS